MKTNTRTQTGNTMNGNDTLTITRDTTDWCVTVGVVRDTATWGRIMYAVQTPQRDVTLTVDQWHGVVNDITNVINVLGMVSIDDIDTNMARLMNTRDAIELALRYDVRNGATVGCPDIQ